MRAIVFISPRSWTFVGVRAGFLHFHERDLAKSLVCFHSSLQHKITVKKKYWSWLPRLLLFTIIHERIFVKQLLGWEESMGSLLT
jgi:hypothetical protein